MPFNFDVHALFSLSDDAVSVEASCTTPFAARRVNRINARREFFCATPAGFEALRTSRKPPRIHRARGGAVSTQPRRSAVHLPNAEVAPAEPRRRCVGPTGVHSGSW